ncbi:unnamed protein product [Schistocephalus solidus]|uniref:Uncharacterized protein n=1 Tax=Schistocephalus solidus TaxID=70667 RepID=A0A183SFL5_SCHSO|nr:unnamed protein product [Schistocephalus solidus]
MPGWSARPRRSKGARTTKNGSFITAIKTVYGNPVKGTAPLLSADKTNLINEKTKILNRWAEHFQSALNRPSTITDATIDRLPGVETNADLDLPSPLQETIRAVQQRSSGKASGSNKIPAGIYKHGDEPAHSTVPGEMDSRISRTPQTETPHPEKGQLEEVGFGYTFFWSGRPKAERRDAAVTFHIRNIVGRLPCLLQGINDRLMSHSLPLRGEKFATIISAYALHNDEL